MVPRRERGCLRHDSNTKTTPVLQQFVVALDRGGGVAQLVVQPRTVCGEEDIRLPYLANPFPQHRLGGLPLGCNSHPGTKGEGVAAPIGKQDGAIAGILDHRIQESEILRTLVPKEQRRRGVFTEILRGAGHSCSYKLRDTRLMTKDGLVHCPLEPVAPETLIPIEAGKLGELAKGHLIAVGVDISEILGAKLVEHRSDNGSCDRVQGSAVLIDGLSLGQEGDFSHGSDPQLYLKP